MDDCSAPEVQLDHGLMHGGDGDGGFVQVQFVQFLFWIKFSVSEFSERHSVRIVGLETFGDGNNPGDFWKDLEV